MKFVIFYFSGTGNTWWATNLLVEELKSTGNEVEAYSLEIDAIKDKKHVYELIKKADILGIGYPIYGSSAPAIMQEFIDNLPDLSKTSNKQEEKELKTVLLYSTELFASGDGVRYHNKNLKKKGYKMKWGVHFQMPNNICMPYSPFKNTTPKKEEKKKKKTALRIKKLVSRINNNKTWIQGRNPISKSLGLSQRHGFIKESNWLSSKMGIDMEICTKCMRCVNICPVNNIVEEKVKLVYQGKCILCMRCYNYCPVLAVTFFGKHHKKSRPLPYRGPTKDFRPEILKK